MSDSEYSDPEPPAAPLAYVPALESIQPDEAETATAIMDTLRGISETTADRYGHAVRSVHAKSLALLQGNLTVLDDLPPSLAQGLFAKPGSYPLVMRFSTSPGDLIDDRISTPRGLAIKVMGVPGARLDPHDGASTQDFILIDGPAFVAAEPKAFAKSLKLLASTTDKAEGLKKVLSSALRGLEAVVEALGEESSTLISLGGHPITNPLGETYYSQTPYRYGDYAAKFSVAPVSSLLTALTKAPVDLADNPDGLRAALTDFFRANGGEWELRVQLYTDPEETPIEDASVPWPEDESAFVPVARIEAAAQNAWSPERSAAIDDGLSFSPWHCLAAHQPLGGINRARKEAYLMSAEFRSQRNGCPIYEPHVPENLPA